MKKGSLPQQLYTWAFIILAVKNILESTNLFKRPELVDKIMIGLFFICILLKAVFQVYTLRNIIIYSILGALCIYTCITLNYYILIFSFLGIITIQDIELEKVVKKTAKVRAGLLLLHVAIYIFIYIVSPEDITYSYRNGVKRHFFLLGHPNSFSMYVLWTSLEYMYAEYKNIKIGKLVFIWFINFITYYFTNSNSGIIVTTITVLLILMVKRREINEQNSKSNKLYSKGRFKEYKYLRFFSKYSFAFFAVLFPFTISLYTKLNGKLLELFITINDFFTGRLMFGAYAYDVYGFTLLGRNFAVPDKIHWRGIWFDELVFDNSYIWLSVNYGVLYAVLIALGFILIAKKTTPIESILIIVMSLYGIMEAYVINAGICFPLLFIGKYLFQHARKQESVACTPRKGEIKRYLWKEVT